MSKTEGQERDINEDDVNKSIASLRAVQQDVLAAIRRIVARVEASQARRVDHALDAESSDTFR
jgi:hypothetical protein